jgi:hypothetical protein
MAPITDKLKFYLILQESYELPENYAIKGGICVIYAYFLHLSTFLCSPFLAMIEKPKLSHIWQLPLTDGTIPALT